MTKLLRSDRHEIMDVEPLSIVETEKTLRFLDRVNRRFGGHSIFINQMETWLHRLPSNKLVTVLDVGTGSGDLPLALQQWSETAGRRLHIVGLEKSKDLARLARQRCQSIKTIEILDGDFFQIHRKFDFVFSNLVLHHITAPQQLDFLSHANRLANQGLLMADLERSWPNYWSVKLAGYIWGNRIVRHDGPLSVKRSLTFEELVSLRDHSSLSHLTVRREPWCRLSIGGLKP